MRIVLTSCLISLCMLLVACQNQEEIKRPPQFRWESFQRFWSKHATPFVSLAGLQKIDTGYMVDYGHSVILLIKEKDKVITGVEVELAVQSNEGGQQFLRMVEQIMDVGVFRWTGAEIATMRTFFGPMSPVKKEFSYKTSHFVRERRNNSWVFSLTFIANTHEITAKPPLEEVIP